MRNFVQLCLEGYYDGCIFHRVIKDFMAQTGDPTGTGSGVCAMQLGACHCRQHPWQLIEAEVGFDEWRAEFAADGSV